MRRSQAPSTLRKGGRNCRRNNDFVSPVINRRQLHPSPENTPIEIPPVLGSDTRSSTNGNVHQSPLQTTSNPDHERSTVGRIPVHKKSPPCAQHSPSSLVSMSPSSTSQAFPTPLESPRTPYPAKSPAKRQRVGGTEHNIRSNDSTNISNNTSNTRRSSNSSSNSTSSTSSTSSNLNDSSDSSNRMPVPDASPLTLSAALTFGCTSPSHPSPSFVLSSPLPSSVSHPPHPISPYMTPNARGGPDPTPRVQAKAHHAPTSSPTVTTPATATPVRSPRSTTTTPLQTSSSGGARRHRPCTDSDCWCGCCALDHQCHYSLVGRIQHQAIVGTSFYQGRKLLLRELPPPPPPFVLPPCQAIVSARSLLTPAAPSPRVSSCPPPDARVSSSKSSSLPSLPKGSTSSSSDSPDDTQTSRHIVHQPKACVRLVRDPDNDHDPNAIEVVLVSNTGTCGGKCNRDELNGDTSDDASTPLLMARSVRCESCRVGSAIQMGHLPAPAASTLAPLLDMNGVVSRCHLIAIETRRIIGGGVSGEVGSSASQRQQQAPSPHDPLPRFISLSLSIAIYATKRFFEAASMSFRRRFPLETCRSIPPIQPRADGRLSLSVLSLFDGIGGARVALDVAGIPIDRYLTSEIDSAALRVLLARYPDAIPLGDVRLLTVELIREMGRVDLVVGGSPCQDLSVARGENREGLHGPKSSLFFEYTRVLREVEKLNPKVVFVFENVKSMRDSDRDEITSHLRVLPVRYRGEEVSAAYRDRYYWTNLHLTPLTAPKRDPTFAECLEPHARPRNDHPKAMCILSSYHLNNIIVVSPPGERPFERTLTPLEAERLLGFPEYYTSMVAQQADGDGVGPPSVETTADVNIRLKHLGNSFCIPVVAHIFHHLLPLLDDAHTTGVGPSSSTQLAWVERRGRLLSLRSSPDEGSADWCEECGSLVCIRNHRLALAIDRL